MKNPKKSELLSGRVIVSEPFLDDDFFTRSVVLLARMEDSGSMGFILNKPLGNFVHEIIDDFPYFEAPVFYGGPVENESMFFIHSIPNLIGFNFQIDQGLYFGGDFEKLKHLIVAGIIQQHQLRFFVGYSGWDSGQLDHELSEDCWFVFERPEILLEMEVKSLWSELIRSTHSEIAIWANFPEDPSQN